MDDWPLGAYSRAALDDLVANKDVTCRIVDQVGQRVGICDIPDSNLTINLLMLARGWAVSYRLAIAELSERVMRGMSEDAGTLVILIENIEFVARSERRGIWRTPVIAPRPSQ